MATDKKLDDAISRWLEAQASGQLPDRVLRATFERTRRSRQQGGWRALLGRIQMPRFVLALSGTAVVVTAAVLALTLLPRQLGVGGPTTQPPSASPSPSPTPSTFSSTVHGISIDYPSGWQVRPATEPWTGGELSYDSPGADVIFDPTIGDRVYIVLASQSLGPDSGVDWRSEAVAWLCTGGGENWAISIDGAHGQAYSCTGSKFAALIPKDGRGYLIRLFVSNGESGSYDFDHWLKPFVESVDLRPEEALDAVSPSKSP